MHFEYVEAYLTLKACCLIDVPQVVVTILWGVSMRTSFAVPDAVSRFIDGTIFLVARELAYSGLATLRIAIAIMVRLLFLISRSV